MWIIYDQTRSEVCRKAPGVDEDLIVTAESVALVEWHLGATEWGEGLETDRIQVAGMPRLAR